MSGLTSREGIDVADIPLPRAAGMIRRSERTVARMIRDGLIPAERRSGRVYLTAAAVATAKRLIRRRARV
jgi:hypothetical protein